MQKIFSKTIVLFIALLVINLHAKQNFTIQPAEKALMEKCQSVGVLNNSTYRGLKVPKGDFKDMRNGVINIGQQQSTFFLIYKENSQFYNRLIIDFDGDMKFTNNTIIKFTKEKSWAEFTIKDSINKCKAQVKIEDKTICLQPTQWMQGTIKQDGKLLKIALVDYKTDGKFTVGDSMFIDKNGNGKFESDEVEIISALIPRNGKLETATVAENGSNIVFAPYTGKTTTFIFSKQLVKKFPKNKLFIVMKGRDSQTRKRVNLTISAFLKEKQMVVPANKYTTIQYVLMHNEKYPLFVYNQRRTTIEAGTQNLDLKPILIPSVDVARGRVEVNVQTKVLGNGYVDQIFKMANDGTLSAPAAPAIEIFKADDLQTPIAKANMHYG